MLKFQIHVVSIILLLVSVPFTINAQNIENVRTDFWNNVRYGGSFGLNFGDGFFGATIAPSAIYEFNTNLALGAGINATFNNQKNSSKTTILGGSIIALYNVIPTLQISAEFEQLNVNRRFDIRVDLPNENFWSPALFFGAGFRNGNVTFGLRYNVLFDEEDSIYVDPLIPFIRLYF